MGAAVREWLRTSGDAAGAGLGAGLRRRRDDMRAGPWRRAPRRLARAHRRGARAGRVGSRAELAVLLELLRDPKWWVRYHAARAITALHGLDPAEVEALQRQAADRFAADMLAHALADRTPAA
jgi:hypothetical protein